MKREEISGTFLRERIAFENGPDDRTAICEIRMADGSEATVKGPLRAGELQRNLQVRMYGSWRNHHKHGRQFVFSSVVVEEPATEAGTVAYLQLCRGPNGERIGIGRATALNLWAEFGPDAVRMLREQPDEACRDIPRFTPEKARMASGWLRENHAVERARIDLIGLLDGRGFPRKVVDDAIRTWGSAAADVLRRNPYHLMRFRGCGFGNTDKMYLDLGHPGDRLKRQSLSAWYSLARNGSGDTWFPLQQAHGAIREAVAGANANVDRATELATRAGMLTVVQRNGQSWVAESGKARSEHTAAVCLAQALQEDGQWPDVSEIDIGDDDAHQREQLTKAVSGGPIAILCGSPGTGKTHAASALIRKLIMTDGLSKVAVCAPTGKAAVRLNEAMQSAGIVGVQATTIHSLLKVESADNGWTFLHNAGDPLPFRWVVVDETSMIDTGLMAHLLAARAPGTHFLFIGDTNQLPPVGHGAPLRDMIRSGVPCGELTEVRRNSGRIVRSCAEIRDTGRFTASPKLDLESGENFAVVRRDSPESQVETLQRLLAKVAGGAYGELDSVWDVQVLVAINDRSPLSRKVLNSKLQGLFNPDGETAPGNPLRVRDKIICLQNGWYPSQDPDADDVNEEGKLYVANGEQAEVLAVEPARTIARLQAPDRIVIIPHGQQDGDDSENRGCAGNWDLGYAITTHRCVHPDTLIETDRGVHKISAVADTGRVATHQHDREFSRVFRYPDGPALRVTTQHGYRITVTPGHKCERFGKDGHEMVVATELQNDDWVRLKLGATIDPGTLAELPTAASIRRPTSKAAEYRVPQLVDCDVAEFLGLMVADGTVFKSGFRLVKRHADVSERFRALCCSLFGASPVPYDNGGTLGFEVSSVFIVDWLLAIGGLAPGQKMIPDCILQSPATVQAAFLRGLFEDGWSNEKNGKLDHIGWCSCVPEMVDTVQHMLLRQGIICNRVQRNHGTLYIYGHQAAMFAEKIGFVAEFKNNRLRLPVGRETNTSIPCTASEARSIPRSHELKWIRQNAISRGYISRHSARLLNSHGVQWAGERLDWHYTRISEIAKTRCESMCLEVPYGHRFLQNGFPWSNSQGSEWPIVVLMIDEHGGAKHLMDRNLIYTTISRGKLATVGIGRMETLLDGCRKDGISGRKTMLAEQIGDELPDGHPLKPHPKPATNGSTTHGGTRHISSVLEELAAARPELDLSVMTQPAVTAG